MTRGEVWVASGGGDFAGKPRPVVIVQGDRFPSTNSVTICPFTTDVTDAAVMRPQIDPSGRNGLSLPSRLMVDKLTTMARKKFSRRIGVLSAQDVARLDRAILAFLDLAGAASPRRSRPL